MLEDNNWSKEPPGKLESIKPEVSTNSNQKLGQNQIVKSRLQGQRKENRAKGKQRVA